MNAQNGDDTPLTLDEIDEQLAWARSDLEEYERLERRLEADRRALVTMTKRIGQLTERVERERRDVDELEGLSIGGIVERLFGNPEARLDKEIQEWLAARLRLEEAQEARDALRAEVDVVVAQLAARRNPRERYHELLARKSRWFVEHGRDHDDRHEHLAEREGALRDALREYEEAIWAGQVAKAALAGVQDALAKAQSLGKLDMLGLASNWVKHEHVDDAQRHASAANRALSRFQMELADVEQRHDAHLTMELSQLVTFADYFFDDLVSDWIVQCRIDRSHRSAGIARTRVNRTLRLLVRRQQSLVGELRKLRDRRRRLSGDDPGGRRG